MNLSDFLTESEISFAEAALAEKLARIGEEHQAALADVNARYQMIYTMARRSVLASMLGVSLSSPASMEKCVDIEAFEQPIPTVDASPVTEYVLPQDDPVTIGAWQQEEADRTAIELPITGTPKTTLRQCYTASELAAKLGVHRDTIAYYKRAGLLPEPLPGTGGTASNPYLYPIPDLKALRQRVNERRTAGSGAGAKAQNARMQQASAPATRYTSRELADAMGAHPSSVSNWVRAGWVTPLDLPDVRGFVFEVPDIEALRQEFEERRKAAKLANGARLREGSNLHMVASRPQPSPATPEPAPTPTPEPKSIDLELESVETPEGADKLVGLEKAQRHPYHWSQALPIVEAAIEQSEDEEPFEVAYQRGASTFVVRPLGGVSADLDPFARVVFEAGSWQIIPSLRTGWLAPQAQALRAAWQRAHSGGSAVVQSGGSTTRSLQR